MRDSAFSPGFEKKSITQIRMCVFKPIEKEERKKKYDELKNQTVLRFFAMNLQNEIATTKYTWRTRGFVCMKHAKSYNNRSSHIFRNKCACNVLSAVEAAKMGYSFGGQCMIPAERTQNASCHDNYLLLQFRLKTQKRRDAIGTRR